MKGIRDNTETDQSGDGPQQVQAGLLSISRMKECLQAICVLIQSIRVDAMDVSPHTPDDDFLPGAEHSRTTAACSTEALVTLS